MAADFPNFPVNRQRILINNIIYSYNAATGVWIAIPPSIMGNSNTSQIIFNDDFTANGSPFLKFDRNTNTLIANTAQVTGSLTAGYLIGDASGLVNVPVYNGPTFTTNTIYFVANSAYNKSNTANLTADSAYLQANEAYFKANTAYLLAYDALPKSGGVIIGDLQIIGNVIVTGTGTVVQTDILSVGDTYIVLNADLPPTDPAFENAGIKVNRGSDYQVSLVWNETDNKWKLTNDGQGWYDVITTFDFDPLYSLSADAYNQANTANITADYAYIQANTATNNAANANAYVLLVGASINSYFRNVTTAGNNWANTISSEKLIIANSYAREIGIAGNSYTELVGSVSNSYAVQVGAASNSYARTVGTAGNNYTILIGDAANTYARLVGAAANDWANTITAGITGADITLLGASVNAYSREVGTAGNSYARTVGTAGNNYTVSYSSTVGVSANAYADTLRIDSYGYANTIGQRSNGFAITVGLSGNAYAITVGQAGNSYAVAVGAQGNNWANTTATAKALEVNTYVQTVATSINSSTQASTTGANAYARAVGDAGNIYSRLVGTSGNNYTISVGDAANSYSRTVGTAGNTFTISVGAQGNNYTNTFAQAVGTAGNSYTRTVGDAGNTYARFVGDSANAYSRAVGDAANSYSRAVGDAGNIYSRLIGTSGNSYTREVGTGGNNYTILVGAQGNNWANLVSDRAYSNVIVSATAPVGVGQGKMWWNTTALKLYVYNNAVWNEVTSSAGITVDVNGNVGIGTNTPTQKLDVRGQVLSTDGTNTAYLNGAQGALELSRIDSISYIDFKTNLTEDYDCRIQQVTDGLVFSTGGSGVAQANFTIDNAGILTARVGNPLLLPETAKSAVGLNAVEFATVPAWCKKITLIVSNLSAATTASSIAVQIGRTTYTTAGYASTAWATTAATALTTGFIVAVAPPVANFLSGIIQFCLVGTNTWISSGQLGYESGTVVGFQSNGRSPNIGNMIDRIKIYNVTATVNFDAGSINVFYE